MSIASKKSWTIAPRAARADLAAIGGPMLAAQVLYSRGIRTAEEARLYLDAGFHDPLLLPSMAAAVDRLRQAAAGGQRTAIFGDFDVDGVSGTALLTRAVRLIGGDVVPYIPHRVAEGHGLNSDAVQWLHQQGVNLVVTVDCGISSVTEIAEARQLGMDVIVTDHHALPDTPPDSVPMVTPRIPGSRYPFTELAGAGLALKLAQALLSDHPTPPPPWACGLAALGTVADLVPLRGENRAIVRDGLAALNADAPAGVRALCAQAGVQKALAADTIAFALAPRLNAAGRIAHARTSLEILTTDSEHDAATLASTLEAFNRERRSLTDAAVAAARGQVDARRLPPVLLVGGAGFQPGVAGLVASRLVEEFARPAIVYSLGDGVVRASARSIPSFSVVAALRECADLFIRYGGHPMAAGFTMSADLLPAFRERLLATSERMMEGREPGVSLAVDCEVFLERVPPSEWAALLLLAPHGAGHPTPLFLSRGLRVVDAGGVGANGAHLRMRLSSGQKTWKAIAFRQGDRVPPVGSRVDAVFTMVEDAWTQPPTLALQVEDFRSE